MAALFPIPNDFFPLMNTAKQFFLNLILGPFKQYFRWEIPVIHGVRLQRPQISVGNGSIALQASPEII